MFGWTLNLVANGVVIFIAVLVAQLAYRVIAQRLDEREDELLLGIRETPVPFIDRSGKIGKP